MNYWECLTHNCGSTRFNNLARHQMEWCDIRKKIGDPPNKTWHDPEIGGLNGDVSRKFYRDWDAYCLEKQQKVQRKDNWTRQYEAHELNVTKHEEQWRRFR